MVVILLASMKADAARRPWACHLASPASLRRKQCNGLDDQRNPRLRLRSRKGCKTVGAALIRVPSASAGYHRCEHAPQDPLARARGLDLARLGSGCVSVLVGLFPHPGQV